MDTVSDSVREGQRLLEASGVPSARLDAEVLLAHVLGIDRGRLVAAGPEPLASGDRARYLALIRRRSDERAPVQHLTGVQEFHSLDFVVDGRVLIPRPETELLVEELRRYCDDESRAGRSGLLAADVGTGSGCIAIAAALTCPGLRCIAVDVSPEALDLARINVRRHAVGDRVRLLGGDLLDPLPDGPGTLDAVVCNPPYVCEAELEGLQEEVRRHDPRVALVSGPTGLEIYERLIPAAAARLRDGGLLALELAFGRHEPVRRMLASGPWEAIVSREDFQGIPRLLGARRAQRG